MGEVGKWLPFDVDISQAETEDDPVYREKSLNTYMKAYKDSLKEEEVEEKQRKEEALKGAKVVTGMTDAPPSTGIGCAEPATPGTVPLSYGKSEVDDVILEEQNNKTEEDSNIPIEDSVDDQINNTVEEKVKIEQDLQESKNNLKELSDKLASINEMYAELKK